MTTDAKARASPFSYLSTTEKETLTIGSAEGARAMTEA